MIADRVITILAASVAVTALIGAKVQSWRLDNEQDAHQQTKLDHAELLDKHKDAALKAQEEQDEKDAADLRRVEQARAEGEERIKHASATAVAADLERDRLRSAYAAAIARSCTPSGTTQDASGSTTPATSPDLLADVQRRLDDAAGTIADFATRTHAAAVTCWQAAQ